MDDKRTGVATHALVSAVTSSDSDRAGIAILLRDRQRDTIYSTSYSTPGVSVETAAYRAITQALRSARDVGAYTMMVYCDVASVVAQLNRQEDVPEHLLGVSLELRAVMNRFRWVKVKLAQSGKHFIAHKLAEGASHGDGDSQPLQHSLRLHFGVT
ncbi:MAG: reverse transcriptase-like protein [candidate division WS1 bacterium]|jgi:ribonuclease HI|nr:reverse transcriptase-like protein [candidate division WS1 bacterium]